MNVLIVHNTYQQPGGEDIVVAQESKLLEQNGHQVHIYLRSNHEIDTLSMVQRLGLLGRVISAKDSKLAVRGLVRDLKPDVVHVHNTFAMISPSVYDACQIEGVPVVQTLHNYRLICPAATLFRNGKSCHECITRGLLTSVKHACFHDSRLMSGAIALMLKTHRARQTWKQRIDAYISLSQFAKNKFVQCGIPANKIHVKPNFVEPDPGGDSHSGTYALFVGRLCTEKGALTLLEAWQNLPSSVPLVIAGDGPLRSLMELEVESKGLRSIRFAGQLRRDEVNDLIKKAAFLIVPSVWDEPFGLVIAEAFACGTPVIGASVGAIPDMLEDQVTGLLFAPGNPISLASKIQWAWDHLPQLETMGKAARKAYESRYTANINYRLLMDIYASAIDNHFRFKRKHTLGAAA
jgi:glycosyltransferase involved in cell wall biosynthesis